MRVVVLRLIGFARVLGVASTGLVHICPWVAIFSSKTLLVEVRVHRVRRNVSVCSQLALRTRAYVRQYLRALCLEADRCICRRVRPCQAVVAMRNM